MTNYNVDQKSEKYNQRKIDIRDMPIDEACGQVLTLDELATLVRELVLIQRNESSRSYMS